MWQIAVDEPAPFELLSPRSLDEAGELAARHDGDCALLAGGTDLLDQLKQHKRTPGYVINLKTIPGLRTVEVTTDRVSIGALTTVGELERSPELTRLCPGLALRRVACGDPSDSKCRNPRRQSPAGLEVSVLPRTLVLLSRRRHSVRCASRHESGARDLRRQPLLHRVSVRHRPGVDRARRHRADSRRHAPRELPLEELFVPPAENITIMHRVARGEVLSHVMVPLRPGTRSTFIKYAMRNSWDFALASVGAALRVESGRVRDVRIVLGGVAPVPWRSLAAERTLEGGQLTGYDDRGRRAGSHCGGSSPGAERIQGRAGEDARAQRADGARPVIRAIRRWFDRTHVRLEPRATSGREVAFAAGYSALELERAGITEEQAIAAGLAIDRTRSSALGSNVMQLQQLRRAKGWR